MKPFALLSIYYFFKIRENYLEKIKFSDYIIFTLLLTITNAIKPNFVLAFAPTVAIFLLIDFIKNIKNKKAIINIILIGLSILISLSVLIYQSYAVYGEETQDQSGIELGFLTVYRTYNRHPIFALLQSAAFPIFVFITNFKKLFKDKNYIFIAIMDIIAMCTFLFINETGERKYHGNFSWGIYFAMLPTFIISLVFFHNLKSENIKHKKAYFISGYSLFLAHLIFGIIYFCKLQLGLTYF